MNINVRHRIKVFLLVLITAALSLSGLGCGGGSDDGSTTGDLITIAIDSGATVTYKETVDSTTPVGFDPYVKSSYVPSTMITLYSYSDYSAPSYNTIVEIRINGTTTGTYQINAGSIVGYTAPDGKVYVADPFVPASSGTIQVDRFDSSAGGLVEGSYNVIAQVAGTLSTTVQLTGTFSVTRDN